MTTIVRAAPRAALTLLLALALAACGKTTTEIVTVTNNVIVTRYIQVTDAPSNYQVEFIPGAESVVGKSTFQLKVTNRPEGTAATNAIITINPVMYMATMNHSAPADVVTESATTPGTYDAAVYYLMMSSPTMGYWDVTATINGETVTFGPDVAMGMGTDTVRKNLWGPEDVNAMMSMATTKYYLFRDGPVTAAGGVLPIHLSRSEDMMMTFKPVYVGAVLAGATGTVTSVSLTASSDGGTTYVAGTHVANGHWTLPVTGLTAGTAKTVNVKLSVNGLDKTADGNVLSAGNASVAFTVTPR